MRNQITNTDQRSDEQRRLSRLSGSDALSSIWGKPLATERQIENQVGACLTQVAPAGFNAADRDEWLSVAIVTIAEMQLDATVLHAAAKAARHDPRCDHPSKIIPAMKRYIDEHWTPLRQARRYAAEVGALPAPMPRAAIAAPIEEIPMSELRAMSADMLRMGLSNGWITQAQVDALERERSTLL